MSKLFSPLRLLLIFVLLALMSLILTACGSQRLPPEALAEQLGEDEIFLVRPGELLEAQQEAANIEAYFQYRYEQMMDAEGKIPDGALMNALEQRTAIEEEAIQLGLDGSNGMEIAGIGNISWSSVGPGNVGGRIRAILPIDASTVFVGSVSGGLWKTTNCCSTSTTWTVVDDFMANLGVQTLIADPTNVNVMYAGTGEGFYNGGGIRGAGVFKSTDGGTTWAQLSSTNNSSWYYVNRLAISPDGTTLLAATGSGVWRSTDGGTTWTKVNTETEQKDVHFHPTDSSRAVSAGYYGKAFYTTDGGVSWAAATGLPAGLPFFGRIEVAYAPSNPNIVYASVNQNSGEVWKSTDGGQSYTLMNTGAGFLGQQGGYDNTIWVNPTDPNNVVVAGLDIYMSTDGGVTLTKISAWGKSWGLTPNPPSPHADHHALVSVPGSSTTLLNGNDGGIYYTADILTAGNNLPDYNNGWVYMNNNLGITQFYGVAGNNNGVI